MTLLKKSPKIKKRARLKLEPFDSDKHGIIVSMLQFNGSLYICTTEGVYIKANDGFEKIPLGVVVDAK
jgi:ligand-binding sensor domain-containing protein